jgi:hypothetical protein
LLLLARFLLLQHQVAPAIELRQNQMKRRDHYGHENDELQDGNEDFTGFRSIDTDPHTCSLRTEFTKRRLWKYDRTDANALILHHPGIGFKLLLFWRLRYEDATNQRENDGYEQHYKYWRLLFEANALQPVDHERFATKTGIRNYRTQKQSRSEDENQPERSFQCH